jgi:hypothetical protein
LWKLNPRAAFWGCAAALIGIGLLFLTRERHDHRPVLVLLK